VIALLHSKLRAAETRTATESELSVAQGEQGHLRTNFRATIFAAV
jgi:hypothetical protein